MTRTRKHSIRIEQMYPVPRQLVYAAWTETQRLQQWFQIAGNQLVDAEIDLQVGGDFRFQMQSPKGEISYFWGRYQVVTPPEKLAFTWNYTTAPEMESQVTLDFQLVEANQTTLVLTHEGFLAAEVFAGFLSGWSPALIRLEELLVPPV